MASFNMVWDGSAWVRQEQGSAGDGAITDGVSSSIKASVLDYTNSNPVAVRLTDTSGDYVAAGAGTQYTEDAASAADPVGGMLMGRRKDTLSASQVSADGDNIALNSTSKGELYVKHTDTIQVIDGGGTISVDDDGSSLTVDSAQLPSALTSGGNMKVAVQETALPTVITRSVRVADSDGAQTDAAAVAVTGSNRIVLTRLTVMADGANSGDCAVRIGFGASTVPAAALAGTDAIVLDATGIKAGGGVQIGDGSGVIGIGAAAEDLRYTCEDPAGGNLTISFSYYVTT